MPISTITTADIMAVIEPIAHSKAETASRLKQRISAVFDYAIQTQRASHNPTTAVPKIVRRQDNKVKHHPALPI
ncbi:phage integrase central domain-containing protein [Suttonella ornithocola]|uniref:phage integrase central domain-containing protein n=1 Tax=Suttonella ornithocola TaxID=279832 RepID=UPI000A053E7F|nr:hypothetical protein [Suttonella ornithocola]